MKQLELKKHGKTKYNTCWGYGTITDTIEQFTFTGIIEFKDDYNLTDGSIYQIKSIDLGFNKKNILRIVVALN